MCHNQTIDDCQLNFGQRCKLCSKIEILQQYDKPSVRIENKQGSGLGFCPHIWQLATQTSSIDRKRIYPCSGFNKRGSKQRIGCIM